jgi:hypothetical protein
LNSIQREWLRQALAPHARVIVEAWRKEYNEVTKDRPNEFRKKLCGALIDWLNIGQQ